MLAGARANAGGEGGRPSATVSPFCARPNRGHRCLAALARAGHVWRFIQQNHDGLPQKAGLPQGLCNEIHGGWFDPSNPVVAMTGGLREDLFSDLLRVEQEADLVLALGTSLCGMNSDRVVVSAAARARGAAASAGQQEQEQQEQEQQEQHGSVIVSLQRTVHDANSSLRIFALIDDVMGLLVEELALAEPPEHQPPYEVAFRRRQRALEAEAGPAGTVCGGGGGGGSEEEEEDVFMIPYDGRGQRLAVAVAGSEGRGGFAGPLLRLDLRDGAEVTVVGGPDHGADAAVVGRNKDGHWRVAVQRRFKQGRKLAFTETRLFGGWWAAELAEGALPSTPLVPRGAFVADAGATAAE